MLGVIIGIVITILIFSVFGPVAGVCWVLFGLKYLNTPSRIAITSGGLKPVLDGGGNGNSIFAESFAKILSSVLTPMTSAELYLQVRDEVTRKSLAAGVDQTPLRGEILAAGHQGPDFVLIPE